MMTASDIQALTDCLQAVSAFDRIPDLARIYARAAAARPRAWGLPRIAARAVGGDEAQAQVACAALACLQLGVVLVDDLLDDDPRGEQVRLGPGPTANLALAFQALAGDVLASRVTHTPTLARALITLQRAALRTAYGQALDTAPVASEDDYWRVVEAKSAGFFGAAFRLGAECAGATPALADGLEALGQLYGQMIQIHDDLADCLDATAGPDWRLGRGTLPLLYARLVDHPARERFVSLCAALEQPGALAEAQDLLWRSGAVSYGLYHIQRRHAQALNMLDGLVLIDPRPLREGFASLMAPVDELLAASE